jgi:Protein DA1
MQLSTRRPVFTHTRGQWCNLCGARLANTMPYEIRGGIATPSTHHGGASASVTVSETSEGDGHIATWSLCVQCYNARLRCASCGMQVGSHGIMLEGERGVYCRDCFESRPRCDTCGRPVGAHYWSRPDGRKLCDRCQSTAISDPQYAHALYRRVRAALSKDQGLTLREPCQLKLVNRMQLAGLIDKSSLYSLDAESRDRCFGLFIREGKHRAIFVEYGLPQIVLMEVMAHEFAHAWQSENCADDAPSQVQEGFAEWVAYKLMQSWGCTRRSDKMLRRDDLYGRGLQMMLQWEQQFGPDGVIRRMRSKT